MQTADEKLWRLERFDRQFSRSGCRGRGRDLFRVQEGTVPILVSAPHAVMHRRDGQQKNAEILTGAIACLLGETCGVHVFCNARAAEGDPNYDPYASNAYQRELSAYIGQHGIRFVLDLHGAASSRDFAVDLGTAPNEETDIGSLAGHSFILDLAEASFAWAFSSLAGYPARIGHNSCFAASRTTTITNALSSRLGVSAMQLEANAQLRDLAHPEGVLSLVEGLECFIRVLGQMDWEAPDPVVLAICQSELQIPQDVVSATAGCPVLDWGEGTLHIAGPEGTLDFAHLREISRNAAGRKLDEAKMECIAPERCLFLTNRLMKRVWGQALWAEPGFPLAGAPILVGRPSSRTLKVRPPLAERIDRVRIPHELYKELQKECGGMQRKAFVFSRLSDTVLPLALEDADYGPAPNRNAGSIYVPRYYRNLLGIGHLPLPAIRSEEYACELQELGDEERALFERCYAPAATADPFRRLRKGLDADGLEQIAALQRRLHFDRELELVLSQETPAAAPSGSLWKRIKDRFLESWIGTKPFCLLATYAEPADDANAIARLSDDMMKLVGVEDNDKIVVRFGTEKVCLRVLSSSRTDDSTISLPAKARAELGMDSVNDIVTAERDEGHIFARSLAIQLAAVLGTVIAVLQLSDDMVFRIIALLLLLPPIVYAALNEERVKVR